MLQFGLLVLIIYLILILSFYFGFDKTEEFQLRDLQTEHKFSILIPFRNEAENIEPLINSLVSLNYPKSHFEVIFIDDESSDDSVHCIKTFIKRSKNDLSFKIVANVRKSNSPKKDAIEMGVAESKFNFVITTDADVELPPFWLDAFDEYLQSNDSNLIVAPVKNNHLKNFLHRYQALDFLSLQGSTIGAFGIGIPFMCNGANLCFNKSVFESIHAFKFNKHVASGDDVFLLEAMIKHQKDKLGYLKCKHSVVTTKPLDSWGGFVQQRVRWASKTRHYRIMFGKMVGLVVLIMNLWIVALPLLVIMGTVSLKSALLIVLTKVSIDFLLLLKTSKFLDSLDLMPSYFITSIIYPFLSSFIALKSLFSPYVWKNRKFSS